MDPFRSNGQDRIEKGKRPSTADDELEMGGQPFKRQRLDRADATGYDQDLTIDRFDTNNAAALTDPDDVQRYVGIPIEGSDTLLASTFGTADTSGFQDLPQGLGSQDDDEGSAFDDAFDPSHPVWQELFSGPADLPAVQQPFAQLQQPQQLGNQQFGMQPQGGQFHANQQQPQGPPPPPVVTYPPPPLQQPVVAQPAQLPPPQAQPAAQGQAQRQNFGTSERARLPQCRLGVMERAAYFPNHSGWGEPIMREMRNGWDYQHIAAAELHAHGMLNVANLKKREAAMRQRAIKGAEEFFGIPKFEPAKKLKSGDARMAAVTNYDASNYRAPGKFARNNWPLFSPTLMQLAAGVVNPPTGQDAGIVTQAINHAVATNNNTWTVDDVPRIAHAQNFAWPAEANGTQWDQLARQRLRAAIPRAILP
ncbi:hypothetical protein Tdes44962_MAKER06283 [Teratosphaeria destructans]|uniref:Uncharacterized protein n=1 Tax=Teratosphaeria destructans TaxID=418781 RepID=A0A9W7SHQ0_9PEZI|nr:hypothetical protein Tdes44962_MAKER06283 [Teratosphaeria destructans]